MDIDDVELGDKDTAPVINNSDVKKVSWSGLREQDFNDSLLAELRFFIQFEAAMKGYMDAVCGVDMMPNSIFHSEFLSGWPNILWVSTYEKEYNEALYSHELATSSEKVQLE